MDASHRAMMSCSGDTATIMVTRQDREEGHGDKTGKSRKVLHLLD